MGSTFEDTVLDFDLNFLQQSPNIVNDCRIEKQKKAILIAKKKTVATDSLIKKYFAKKEQLEQTELVLLTAKEECKQVCIDYKGSLEKCTQLEKEVQSLQNLNKELQSNCELMQNQVEAIRSHSHQLEELVTEHETVIEALKKEKQKEKENKPNKPESDKNLLNTQKENATLLNDICVFRDIVLGKKKLNKRHKLILKKYDKIKSTYDVNDSASENSSDETEFDDSSPSSPFFSTLVTSEDKDKESDLKAKQSVVCSKKGSTRINKDYDSDCSNERVSEDTGRGSSLAFSDGEKCFNSPDYFNNDSPFAPECNKIKERRVFVDACTSPIAIHEVVHIATSPLLFDDEALLSDNNMITSIEKDSNNTEYFITDIPLSTEIVTIKEKKSLVDIGTSTVDIKMMNVSTSPVVFEELDLVNKKLTHTATSPILNIQNCTNNINITPDMSGLVLSNDEANNVINVEDALSSVEIRHKNIQKLSSQCELEISNKSLEEKMCLERNNSRNLCSENSNDFEIEMILNSMRLSERLITPIPKTPAKISKKDGKKQISHAKQQLNSPKEHIVCTESVKLREENRALQTSISDLSKEIMNIKSILKKQHLMPETPKKHVSEVNTSHINSELFNDSSEKVIFVHLDGEENSDNNNKDKIHYNGFSNSSMEYSISPIPTVEKSVIRRPVIQSIQVFPAGSQVRSNNLISSSALELHKSSETLPSEDNAKRKKETNFDRVSLVDSRTIIEDNLRMESEGEETLVCDNNKEIILNNSKCKNVKHKKISRLEKFRKKLLPKSKIKRINVPIRKLHTKSKVISVTKSKNLDSELLENNKSAYEKALKVMKDLKLKKGTDEKQGAIHICNTKAKNIEKDSETNNNRNDSRCDFNEKYSPKNKSPIEIKQPIVCLSPLPLDNLMGKDKQPKINAPSPRKSQDILLSMESSPTTNIINTRSRTKSLQESLTSIQVNSDIYKYNEFTKECTKPAEGRKRLKRAASDNPPVECKRVLRSQNVREIFIDQVNAKEDYLATTHNILKSSNSSPRKKHFSQEENESQNILIKNISKSDELTGSSINTNTKQNIDVTCPIINPKESILCIMLEKFGKTKIKYSAKKISDEISNLICKKLEEDIAKIIALPIDKTKSAMNKLVEEIKHTWKMKKFLLGFMKYLKNPARKQELFNKVSSPPAPPMTKAEQILLYVIRQLQISTPNTVSIILTHIEFSLFQLNKTPHFDVIESMSHFYALLCRYFGLKNRLRQFLLDAMYCLQFKVVPLIKQCLDVWMHILPLAHMGIAKSPLVTCLVYLLHFYKCEDKFNRIQDIRFILNKKYFYQITDWNETKILEMFRNSIKELRDIKVEKKMLRMALIILAKRQGPKWCQKNIVKNMLLPMIEKEDVPMMQKQFCVELLGPLLKPYPGDMKVHCEIVVNQLLDMLEQKIPDSMKEAIFTSLIYMNKHNQNRVPQSLLSWSPKRVSPEFEGLMKDFIREKPLRVWKGILSRTCL
ncbi:uncharacterized protein LOC126781163 [Nymphalis io]|uniref:uncharacterized protein LOC126781163 n=1 Tax=Inachis io TaxID=171585 RepID=UPI00216918B6|nr:uncharacterized protein LOC126781163 [Nymphalis io]